MVDHVARMETLVPLARRGSRRPLPDPGTARPLPEQEPRELMPSARGEGFVLRRPGVGSQRDACKELGGGPTSGDHEEALLSWFGKRQMVLSRGPLYLTTDCSCRQRGADQQLLLKQRASVSWMRHERFSAARARKCLALRSG